MLVQSTYIRMSMHMLGKNAQFENLLLEPKLIKRISYIQIYRSTKQNTKSLLNKQNRGSQLNFVLKKEKVI